MEGQQNPFANNADIKLKKINCVAAVLQKLNVIRILHLYQVNSKYLFNAAAVQFVHKTLEFC